MSNKARIGQASEKSVDIFNFPKMIARPFANRSINRFSLLSTYATDRALIMIF